MHRVSSAPLHYVVPVPWPGRGQHLFVLSSYTDCQPLGYRTTNKQTKRLTVPAVASQDLTFREPVLTFIVHSRIPWDTSVDTVLLFPPRFPFLWLGFLIKNETKQSKSQTNH